MQSDVLIPAHKKHYFFIGMVSMAMLVAMLYSFFASDRMVKKFTPLVDATMEIKVEATTAHLWLEELIGGDRYEDFEDILGHLEKAEWFARAMLSGGQNSEGTFIPLSDDLMRREVEQVLTQLAAFKTKTKQRYGAIQSAGIGSDIDQQYDRLFKKIINQIDNVETLLQRQIARVSTRSQAIQVMLIVAIVILSLFGLFIQFRFDREQKKNLIAFSEAKDRAEASETWLKTTMNSMGDGVIITDHNGIVTYLNPVASSLTGWRLNEAKNKKMTEVFHIVNEYTKEPVTNPVKDVIRKNVVVGLANHTELIARDGTVWPISDSAAPIFDQAHNLLGVVVVFHEITAQKSAEAEKEKLEAQLRHVFKMEAIGTMAGGIAHDFNNILAIILGNADMALDDIPAGNQAEHNLKEILTAATRAKELVKQILSFSRQEESRKEPLHLCQLVKESMHSLRSTIPATVEQKVTIPGACRKDIHRCKPILADATQIHQLLMNLCVNAVQAMDEKGVLTVMIEEITFSNDIPDHLQLLKPGNYLCFSVSDTGHGIRPEMLDKIFDPFFTTKAVGQGTGMGLSVVHGIVEGHGGEISVSSKPGEGTTFQAYFPTTDLKPRVIRGNADQLPTGREHILLVDDEPMLARVGQEIIERLGYTVTVTTDSPEALTLFRNDPSQFDLVITDQTMPRMSGAELAGNLLDINPTLPVILCTGYSSKVDKAAAKQIGISQFAAKPLKREEIAHLIRKVLDDSKSTKDAL